MLGVALKCSKNVRKFRIDQQIPIVIALPIIYLYGANSVLTTPVIKSQIYLSTVSIHYV